MCSTRYKAVVIGVSAGGMAALTAILSDLANTFPVPIFIVQHLMEGSDSYLCNHLSRVSNNPVVEPNDKEGIEAGIIYVAPPGYHMELDSDKTISLSSDPRVNYSRPSIDLLFTSAADVYREHLVAVILTGANMDGTAGIKRVRELHGHTLAQDPSTAEVEIMPQSAIDTGCIEAILPLNEVASYLNHLIIGEDNEQ